MYYDKMQEDIVKWIEDPSWFWHSPKNGKLLNADPELPNPATVAPMAPSELVPTNQVEWLLAYSRLGEAKLAFII